MKRYLLLFAVAILCHTSILAQVGNNMCEGALPFCTGTSYSFPAGTGTPSAQSGPYYSCLTTTPNPAWYYMKIALPGMIQITMHSEPAHDIDFCLWGPFDNQNACGQLTSNKVIDCSYSTAATEVVDIANAIAGKFYILIITNFSNQPCNIIFQKTGGQGTTDCTILPPAATNDGPLCVGETLHLHAANMNNAVYHWYAPDGWTSTQQNPVRNNVQLSMAGIYSLFVTVNGQPSADTNHTNVAIFNPPTASLRGGGTICQGDSTLLTITCQNHPPWTVTMTANGQSPVNIPIIVSPYTTWVKPTTSTTYALTSVGNEICNGQATGSVQVDVNAKPMVNFNINNNCSGVPTQFNDGTMVPGGSAAAWFWNFGFNNDTSNIQNPTYTYPNGGLYSVKFRVTSNNGCKAEIVKPVQINPSPLANAGIDKSIAYGTNTSLSGSASGGTGAFSYHWEPANKLVNPDVQNPSTINLVETTDFTLTVNDQGNGCSHADIVTVTITGGPMGVQLVAQPDAICLGSTTTINTIAGGGSGSFTYSWSSNPPGFTSTNEDITVQPAVTTTYNLEINDGFNILNKTVTITVYPQPVASAGSPQTIYNGTYTLLSGSASSGLAPYTYSWSPAALVVHPDQPTTTTSLLSSTTSYTLTVTDIHGCVSSDEVVITIQGGPLAVHPVAQTPICYGESTMLKPMGEGGSGNYQYSWSAPGYQSGLATPVVSPLATTTYQVVVSDGFTQNQGTVTVVVNPLPDINLIPAGAHVFSTDTIMACVFDTLAISAELPNCTYLWSNGATTPDIQSLTTGIAFDLLSYSVHVTNLLTSCSNDADLTVIFTYSECSYGTEEKASSKEIDVYPNPGTGLYYCTLDDRIDPQFIAVTDIRGRQVTEFAVEPVSSGRNHFTLNITSQPKGVYLLRVTGSHGTLVHRLVKY